MIKICGISSIEHALAAAQAGANMIGMIFASSRRQVSPEQAAAIRNALNQIEADQRPLLAGVFVNADAEDILTVVDYCGLDIIQLSGDEPLDMAEGLGERQIIKTVRLKGERIEQPWLQYPLYDHHHPKVRLHVDAHVAGSYGGSGVMADWERAEALARCMPIILAGGLNAENVQEAILKVRPWGVDVSSGVETDGVKDSQKIRMFIEAVRSVSLAT